MTVYYISRSINEEAGRIDPILQTQCHESFHKMNYREVYYLAHNSGGISPGIKSNLNFVRASGTANLTGAETVPTVKTAGSQSRFIFSHGFSKDNKYASDRCRFNAPLRLSH